MSFLEGCLLGFLAIAAIGAAQAAWRARHEPRGTFDPNDDGMYP